MALFVPGVARSARMLAVASKFGLSRIRKEEPLSPEKNQKLSV
jgi:hypothetical protein